MSKWTRADIDKRPFQPPAIQFIKDTKRCALFIDPGLGKTVISATSITELIDDLECGMTLVVAPPTVASKTWPDEFKDWQHLNDVSYVKIEGSPAQRRKMLKRRASFHLISMENLPWLIRELGGKAPERRRIGEDGEIVESEGVKWLSPKKVPYNAIILDESSGLKNQDSLRWKALNLIAGKVEYFIQLTGTPASNGLQDIWAPFYLLDRGARLGHTQKDFRSRWCDKTQSGYKVKAWAEAKIEQAIADITFTLREEDYAKLPPRMYNTIKIELTDDLKKKYKKLEREYVIQFTQDEKLKVTSGAALTTKLLQLANGVVYGNVNDDEEEKPRYELHRLKLDALRRLVDEVPGQTVFVAYQFQSDADRILKEFKGAEIFRGSKTHKNELIDRWNRGEIPMLLVHPKSAAHGLNLQFGGNVVVWYGPTWSLESYIQLNKRLHRSGQKKAVMIHHLIVTGTIDVDVMKSLRDKNRVQETLLNALKQRIRMYVDVKAAA